MTITHYSLLYYLVLYALIAAGLDSVLKSNMVSFIGLPLSVAFVLLAFFFNPGRAFKHVEFFIVFYLFVLGLTYFVISDTSLMSAIGSLKDFMPGFLVFIAAIALRVPQPQIDKLIHLIYYFCYLQIPVTFIQVFLWGGLGDHIGGIFGYGGNQLILFAMVCFNIISASYYLTGKISLARYGFDLACSLIPVTLASTVFSYILLFVHLLLVVFFARKSLTKFVNLIVLSVLAGFFMILVAFIHDAYRERGNVSSYLTSGGIDNLSSYGSGLTKEGTYGRMRSLGVSFDEVCESNFCQGYGFGSTNIGSNDSAMGLIEKKHSYRKIGRTQVSFLIIEVGIVGLILVIFLYICIYRRVNNCVRLKTTTVGYIAKLTILTLPVLFIYQKPLNFVFSSFIFSLFLAFPFLMQLSETRESNEG